MADIAATVGRSRDPRQRLRSTSDQREPRARDHDGVVLDREAARSGRGEHAGTIRHPHVVAADVRRALGRAADEPQDTGLERDLQPPGSRSRDGKIEDARPSCGQRLWIRCRELDAGDRLRVLSADVPLPAGPGPSPRARRPRVVDRQDRAADICGVEMGAADVVQIGLPDHADADRGQSAAILVEPLRLKDDHVAAVAVAMEEAARGRRAGDGRDDLQEGVADRHDGVHQAELRHRGIAEGDVEPEDGREVRDRLLEVARGDHHLSETHGANFDRPGSGVKAGGPGDVRLSCILVPVVESLESMVGDRRRLRVAWAIVLLVGLAHRVALFLLHRGQLDALIDANANWYTYQNLPREMLGPHLLRSLLYLQQTPPASNLFMGLALKWFSWPGGVAYALIWLQTLICLTGALVLVHVLALLYPGRAVLWTAIGLLFVLNTDLVVLEYNSMGQTLYGPLAMLLLPCLFDRLLLCRLCRRMRDAAAVGLAMGLLVLTRATWSYLPVVCILLVAVFTPARRGRGRAVLACVLPIVLLQGGWAVKNWMVYGGFSLTTTTWGGMHARAGMNHAGVSDEFARYQREHVTQERGYPAWQVAGALGDPLAMLAFPQDIRNQDAAINKAMGMENPLFNTLVFRTTCAMDQRIFLEFVRANPGTMARKSVHAYGVFWQPIANYGQMFVDLFAVGNHLTASFDLRNVAAQLRDGSLPDTEYVTSGLRDPWHKLPPSSLTPTNLYTVRWLEPFILVLNLISVHVLLPLLAIWWLASRLRRPPSDRFDTLRLRALLVAVIFFGFLADMVNLVETVEHMRYRLEVEPMIWLIALSCVTELTGILRRPRLPAL